jgi:hypothetical protein
MHHGVADVVPCGGAAHPRPKPKSASHDSKAKHAQGKLARERAGPDADARASAARGARPRKALSLSPSPHIERACVTGRGRGPKRPPTPQSPAATRARSRTAEVDLHDRRVLLERGRQSCRAVGADTVVCGGAAHPRLKALVSATRFQAEARAREARTRTRGARRCCQGERSPRRATAQKHSHSPSPHIGRACAASRGRGPKRPQTPQSPAATRARSRTSEVDRRDRRVLLERGRQSCRASVTDAVPCGEAAQQRLRAQVSATRFQAEARAREARTRTRGGRRSWQGERSPSRAAAQKHSHSPSPHIGRACAAGRGRGPQRPPTPPSVAATRARSRTVEVDRRDRRVLLEPGRQSCRAAGADTAACGGAAHPRPRAQVSATRFQAEAREQRALARERVGPDAAGRAIAARGARPRKGSLSVSVSSASGASGAPARQAAAVGSSDPNPRGQPGRLAHWRVRATSPHLEFPHLEAPPPPHSSLKEIQQPASRRHRCRSLRWCSTPATQAQVSVTRFRGEARAREARTRGARRCWQGERSPRRATAQGSISLSLPAH